MTGWLRCELVPCHQRQLPRYRITAILCDIQKYYLPVASDHMFLYFLHLFYVTTHLQRICVILLRHDWGKMLVKDSMLVCTTVKTLHNDQGCLTKMQKVSKALINHVYFSPAQQPPFQNDHFNRWWLQRSFTVSCMAIFHRTRRWQYIETPLKGPLVKAVVF